VNISLDTLQRDRYQHITGEDKLSQVLRGIEKAKSVGLEPVKINTVVMRGTNDDELLDFAALSLEEGWHVRFIELMPFGKREEGFMPVQEMKQRLAALGELEPYPVGIGNGPARYFRLPRSKGTIGFITPISEHFCLKCNRLRLMADGRLRPCLLSNIGLSLRDPLRRGAPAEEIKRLLLEAAAAKPLQHQLSQGLTPEEQSLSQVGG
jgi:cyclic pyranopterin phosphate synthase